MCIRDSVKKRDVFTRYGPQARAVLDALCADLAQRPYEPTETARRVRSACQARTPAIDVSLRDVVFLLRGMQLNGHVFGRGLDDVHTLAQRLTNQMLFLCQRGLGLRAGQFVTTGTCMPPLAIAPGDRVVADFGVLGQVSAAFTA